MHNLAVVHPDRLTRIAGLDGDFPRAHAEIELMHECGTERTLHRDHHALLAGLLDEYLSSYCPEHHADVCGRRGDAFAARTFESVPALVGGDEDAVTGGAMHQRRIGFHAPDARDILAAR